jgi:hypothetical protein
MIPAAPGQTTDLPTDDLLRQIDDIKGFGEISLWPLAPGWWVLVGLTAIAVVIAFVVVARRRARRRSWKGEADQTLSDLAANLNGTNAQATAAALSAALRRIAMRKFSRAEFAGLAGEPWLQGLQAHDPRGFDWSHAGHVLLDAPYAPPDTTLRPEAVRTLIHAAMKWVD